MLVAWRIVKKRHARSAFDGEGARRHGGRWNSPGTPIVYASESRALSLLEVLAGLGSMKPLGSYLLIPVTFDDALVTKVAIDELPSDWRASPPRPSTQRIGDEWAARESSAVLQLPSAIVPEEFNVLFNPSHPDFARLRIGEARPFRIDARLLE